MDPFSLAILGFWGRASVLNFQLLSISSIFNPHQARGLPWLVSTGPPPAGGLPWLVSTRPSGGFSLSASHAQDHWLHIPQCNGRVNFASAPTTQSWIAFTSWGSLSHSQILNVTSVLLKVLKSLLWASNQISNTPWQNQYWCTLTVSTTWLQGCLLS